MRESGFTEMDVFVYHAWYDITPAGIDNITFGLKGTTVLCYFGYCRAGNLETAFENPAFVYYQGIDNGNHWPEI